MATDVHKQVCVCVCVRCAVHACVCELSRLTLHVCVRVHDYECVFVQTEPSEMLHL